MSNVGSSGGDIIMAKVMVVVVAQKAKYRMKLNFYGIATVDYEIRVRLDNRTTDI